jgi:hypothetical protein
MEDGQDRRLRVHRGALRLTNAQRDELEAHLMRLLKDAEQDQDDERDERVSPGRP